MTEVLHGGFDSFTVGFSIPKTKRHPAVNKYQVDCLTKIMESPQFQLITNIQVIFQTSSIEKYHLGIKGHSKRFHSSVGLYFVICEFGGRTT